MWTLLKDSLRRNGTLLASGCVIAFFLFPTFIVTNDYRQDRGVYIVLLCVYCVICYAGYYTFSMRSDMSVLRVLRSLPFSASALARLAWLQSTLTFPVLAFVMFNAAWLGNAGAGGAHVSFAWPFLFFILGVFFSGLSCFFGLSYQWTLACITDGRGVKAQGTVWLRYLGLNIPALYALIRLLSPPPLAWSELRAGYVAGIAIAFGLTVLSYRMRIHLMRIAPAPGSIIAPAIEKAPPTHNSRLWALAVEWRSAAIFGATMVTAITGAALLVEYFWGARPWSSTGMFHQTAAMKTPIVFAYATLMAGSSQLSRLKALRAFRSLPLTGGRCALLLLSYEIAALLGVATLVILMLWMIGDGRLLLAFLAGIVSILCALPLLMLVFLRYGASAAILASGVGMFVVILFFSLPTSGLEQAFYLPSPGVLWAGALVFIPLGFAGYYGLRRVIETNSEVYHRKSAPQQSGQR
ncbi:MAG: hypothetical protein HZB26_26245 [Candidatus Hydrogenedentes bacterium]|nr:hypothetical protein [Candidatus Hydrogenedentota bacterium]